MKHKEIIDNLTLYEKAAMLSGKNVWQTRDIKHMGIQSIFLSDGPHGLRKQSGAADHLGLNASEEATCFPTAATIANSWDAELGRKIGEAIAEEAVAYNVHVVLGPGLNIKRSPLCGRNFEYFSEDPYLTGKLAAGYIRGIQNRGVVACPKHFAVNNQELRRMSSNSVVDERALHEIYLTGFEIAIKESRPNAIMTSYNEINGCYANENKYLLKDILRNDWGFDGAVITDWGGSNDHVMGVKSGSTLEMPSPGLTTARELIEAINNGQLSINDINERVDELLTIVLNAKQTEENGIFDRKNHHLLALRAAEQSIVLLKNEEKILPIQKVTKVAIVGDFAKSPRYQGAGSSIVNPTKLDTVIDSVKDIQFNYIGYEQGFLRSRKENLKLIQSAVTLAEKADTVVLFLGLDELSESEGLDRRHLKLPQNQIHLLEAIFKVNQNIVVVLSAGSVIEMPWINRCKALIHGYLSGQAGALAILNVLTGKVNPSGKLAETYPLQLEDTPCYNYFPSRERDAEYRESIFVGYRYYESAKIPVLFPFGYGLSYTKFEYSDIEITDNSIHFKVKNIGEVEGTEIAQLYIQSQSNDIYRPTKELKGFARVDLMPHEIKQVILYFDETTFRYYNIKTKRFEVEGGTYTLLVGSNVQSIHLQTTLEIEGSHASMPYNQEELPSYYSACIKEVPNTEFLSLINETFLGRAWGDTLIATDSISQLCYAKSLIARLVYKIINTLLEKSEKNGKPNLNILFIYNMSFNGIAKMTGGVVDGVMISGILTIVNGHFFKGLAIMITGYFRNRKNNKLYETLLNNEDSLK